MARSEQIGPGQFDASLRHLWSALPPSSLPLLPLLLLLPPLMTRVMDHRMVVVRMRLTFKAFAVVSSLLNHKIFIFSFMLFY